MFQSNHSPYFQMVKDLRLSTNFNKIFFLIFIQLQYLLLGTFCHKAKMKFLGFYEFIGNSIFQSQLLSSFELSQVISTISQINSVKSIT